MIDNAVSSMTAVVSSIENDRQTYRWFLMFIRLPEIRQKLYEQHTTKGYYNTLKKIQIIESLFWLVLALIVEGDVIYCHSGALIKQIWFLFAGGILLVILVNLYRKKRKCVAAISEAFLRRDFSSAELERQSLFQICEYFSREYHIPSLVDISAYQDFIGRKVLLGAVLFLPFLYPFTSWQVLVVAGTILLITMAAVNILMEHFTKTHNQDTYKKNKPAGRSSY